MGKNADGLNRAEQQRLENNFKTWLNNDPAGSRYRQWGPGAVRLVRQTVKRDEQWEKQWNAVIEYFRDQVPLDEQERLYRRGARLEQRGLKTAAVLAFLAAAVAAVWFIASFFAPPPLVTFHEEEGIRTYNYDMTYEQCLEAVEIPEVEFVTSTSQCAPANPARGHAIRGGATAGFLALGIVLLMVRSSAIKRARADTRVLDEAEARETRFGYDPLLVGPGEVPFPWFEEPRFRERVNAVAGTMALRYNRPTDLPATNPPKIAKQDHRYPREVNAMLATFAAEDGQR